MKKFFALLFALIMTVSLASCGGDPEIPADVNWEECLVTETVSGMLTVTGVTDLGKSQQVIVIPATVGGAPLKAIGKGAFNGCQQLKNIYINADSSISYLNNGAFEGAISLSKIIVGKKHSEITVSSGLMDGAASGAKFYVPSAYYADYTTDYQWGAFSSKIQRQE